MNVKKVRNFVSGVIIVSILLGILSGCKKENILADSEKTTESVSISATDTTTSTTIAKSEQTETTAEVLSKIKKDNKKFLVAEKNDQKSFAKFMAYILGYGGCTLSKDPPHGDEGYTEKDYFEYNYKDYMCTDKDAFKMAFSCMLGLSYAGIEFAMREAYDIEYDSYFKTYEALDSDTKPEADPLRKFVNIDEYAKFDGKTFDSMLEKIFNVKPDHSYSPKCENDDEEVSVYAYYYEGDYYIFRGKGGDGAGPQVRIVDMQLKDDGKYVIRISYEWGNDYYGYEKVANLEVTAGLVEWNGLRVWSLYSITKI